MFQTIILSLGLSIDAIIILFILSQTNKKIHYISIFIGIFHFLLPILSNLLILNIGVTNFKYLNIFVFVVFMYLAIKPFLDDDVNVYSDLKISEVIILALSVSIDSLFIGLTYSTSLLSDLYIPITFGIVTGLLSIITILLSSKGVKLINEKRGNILTSLLFFIFAILKLFNFI